MNVFNKILQDASKHAVPAGYHHNFMLNLPPEAIQLANKRDDIPSADPHDLDISVLNEQID